MAAQFVGKWELVASENMKEALMCLGKTKLLIFLSIHCLDDVKISLLMTNVWQIIKAVCMYECMWFYVCMYVCMSVRL